MSDKAKKVLKYALSILIAAALVYFAFGGIEWKNFLSSLSDTRPGGIILSLIAAILALVLRALRWKLPLNAIDEEIPLRKVWYGNNIGNLCSIAIPGIGEFYRCGHVSTKRCPYDRTFGTIIVERFWDFVAIIVLGAVAIVAGSDVLGPFVKENVYLPLLHRFNIDLWWVAVLALLFVCGSCAAVWFLRDRVSFFGKCIDKLRGVSNGIAAFIRMPHKLLFIVYTIGIWLMYILMSFFVFKAIPGLEEMTFGDAIFISALGNIASVIPTPGNIGPYHYLISLMISSIYGYTWELGLLFATLSHGSHAILIVILGIYSWTASSVRKDKKEKI